VTLPLTMPGILAGCLLTFVPSISLFFISDLLGGSKNVLMGNLIHTTLLRSKDLPFASALAVVMLMLTGAFIALFRKSGGKSSDIAMF